ncbi:MAG TPA: 50S ribosomal protein L21 [Cryomorphaceae bacterium]|nr:50S ribosomal protein L21 [Cryomorphaceae bacterium]
MYAVVNIAGQQFKVEKDQQIYVHRLPNKEGEKVTFSEVLLVDNNGKVEVGAPVVSGAEVTGKVLEHLKGDKVIVFKKKRRKGYQTRNGHRQYLSKISIDGISLGGKKATAKEEAPKKEEAKAEAKPAPKAAEAKKPAAETKKAKAADAAKAKPKTESKPKAEKPKGQDESKTESKKD